MWVPPWQEPAMSVAQLRITWRKGERGRGGVVVVGGVGGAADAAVRSGCSLCHEHAMQ